MTTLKPDFDTPGEWLAQCEWVHPRRYYKCPFCELTFANERIKALEQQLFESQQAIFKEALGSLKLNKRLKVLEDALDGLLDGLDANSDGREGFTNIQWQKRIAQAHKALEVKP